MRNNFGILQNIDFIGLCVSYEARQVCRDRCTSILLGVCPKRPDLSSGPPGGRGYFVSLAEIPAPQTAFLKCFWPRIA